MLRQKPGPSVFAKHFNKVVITAEIKTLLVRAADKDRCLERLYRTDRETLK
jgi:hypothetical protein